MGPNNQVMEQLGESVHRSFAEFQKIVRRLHGYIGLFLETENIPDQNNIMSRVILDIQFDLVARYRLHSLIRLGDNVGQCLTLTNREEYWSRRRKRRVQEADIRMRHRDPGLWTWLVCPRTPSTKCITEVISVLVACEERRISYQGPSWVCPYRPQPCAAWVRESGLRIVGNISQEGES